MAQRTDSLTGEPDGFVGTGATRLRPEGADAESRRQALLGAEERGRLQATPGIYRRAWRVFRRNQLAMVALAVLIAIIVFVVGARVVAELAGYGPNKGNLRGQLLAPFSGDHVLGTDVNGRDILVRLAYGGRTSLLVAGLAAAATLGIGGLVGAVSGYFGGFVDAVLMRVVDVLLCLPGLSLLILVSALYTPGPVALAFLLAAISWAGIARLVRAEVLSLKARDYVDAARVIGASTPRIIGRHILPNVVPIMLVWISLAIPGLILAEASLSFLGLGVQIPTPSWGNMLQSAKDFYTKSWTNVFIPGFMIYITVLAINLVGNGLRDALDPRLSD